MLTILPDLRAIAWAPERPDQHWYDTLGLAEAFAARWDTDAMYLPYWAEQRVGNGWQPLSVAPRLRKTDLVAFEGQGYRLRMRYGVLDVDCREAHAGMAVPPGWHDGARMQAKALVPGALCYDTRRGIRVVWSMGDAVSPSQWEAEIARAHAVFDSAGLPADRLPWNQVYRLPRGTRDGQPVDLYLDQYEPAVWVPRPPAADKGPRFALPERAPAGERHGTLKSLAASLRAKNFGRDEILLALREADLRVCDPPVQSESGGARELEQLADHFGGLPPGRSEDWQPSAPPTAKEAPAERAPMVRGDAVEVAALLEAQLTAEYGEAPVFAEGHVYTYRSENGRWAKIDDQSLVRRVSDLAGWPILSGANKDGTAKVRALAVNGKTWADAIAALQARVAAPDFFAKAPAGVAFADGYVVCDAGGAELFDHSPEWRCRYGYDFAWTDEPPAVWLEFLAQVFEPTGPEEARRCIRILFEAMGAGITGIAHHYAKLLNLMGGGANGKSVTSDVLAACFPEGSVVWMGPHEFSGPYNLAELVGKRLVVCTEIPASNIDQLTAAAIKRVVSGERMMGRRIYQSPFEFRPAVLVVGALNALPRVADGSDGYFRRQLILAFLRKFAPEEQDPGIAKKILSIDRERIVCWAVRCAAQLVARGHYDEPAGSMALVDEWRKGLDPVRQFAEDALEYCAEGTASAVLYQHYRTWATRNGHVILDAATFWRRFGPPAQSRYGVGWFGPKDRREKRYKVRYSEN